MKKSCVCLFAVKMLVIFRNPKDTLVSYFHFYNSNPVLPAVEWDSFFRQFMKGDGERQHILSLPCLFESRVKTS